MTASIVFLQLFVLGVVLESDVGRRKIGWFRVVRPVIGVSAIIPGYLTSVPTGSGDLVLQAVGAGSGILLGLVSVSPLFVSVYFDPAYRSHLSHITRRTGTRGTVVSRAGVGYALIWIGLTLFRLGFAYGAQHVFPGALAQFMIEHRLSADALTNAFIFLSLGMDLFRSILLAGRGWTVTRRARSAGARADGRILRAARSETGAA
ncbi:MAG TPA: hypothetical protein VGM10_18415 [Actinocrinis sp.]|jgi:hypothetical protein